MEFKYRIRDLRRESNLTADELGKIVGVSRFSVSNWETGRNQPNNDILFKLSEYFNCSIDYLLGRTDQRRPAENITADDFTIAFSNLQNELSDDDKQMILTIAQTLAEKRKK